MMPMPGTSEYQEWLIKHIATHHQEMIAYMEQCLDADGYDQLMICVGNCIKALRLKKENEFIAKEYQSAHSVMDDY